VLKADTTLERESRDKVVKVMDKTFDKLRSKFTEEEKLIVENIIVSILAEDKTSAITQSFSGNGDPLRSNGEEADPNISEYIFKEFIFKGDDHRIFFLKSYRQRLGGAKEDEIKMIAYSASFANSSIDNSFYAYLKYDNNNRLTTQSIKEVEVEISQSVRDSIILVARK
jgi:hypothetical protein